MIPEDAGFYAVIELSIYTVGFIVLVAGLFGLLCLALGMFIRGCRFVYRSIKPKK